MAPYSDSNTSVFFPGRAAASSSVIPTVASGGLENTAVATFE